MKDLTADPDEEFIYAADAMGNIGQLVALADDYGSATGSAWDDSRMVAKYEYDPYGNVVGPDSDGDGFADAFDDDTPYAAANVYRFSTKPQDAETGLSYYGYRYYNARLGRWINRDPLEERGSLNIYAAHRNSSVEFYDALGLQVSWHTWSDSTFWSYKRTKPGAKDGDLERMDFTVQMKFRCRDCSPGVKQATITDSNKWYELDKVDVSISKLGVKKSDVVRAQTSVWDSRCPEGGGGDALLVIIQVEWITHYGVGVDHNPDDLPFKIGIGGLEFGERRAAKTYAVSVRRCDCEQPDQPKLVVQKLHSWINTDHLWEAFDINHGEGWPYDKLPTYSMPDDRWGFIGAK